MDSPLNYSRFSKPDSDVFKSTGTSLVFKTVGRNTKPSWSNRIVKDVNDLTYTIDLDLIGKQKFHSMTLRDRRSTLSADKKAKISVRDKRKSFFSDQLQKIIKSARFFASKDDKKEAQPSRARDFKDNLSTIQTYGLCDYEFKNTINGKLVNKSNMHLKFDKKAVRKMENKITWYNPELQINVDKMDQKKYRRVLDKFHSFQSYTDRKVFETKESPDKVYEIEQGKRKTSPNRIKRTVPLNTVPGRKDDQIKESSYLSYEIRRGERATLKSAPKYSIMATPKKFEFSRQVINHKRGCYR